MGNSKRKKKKRKQKQILLIIAFVLLVGAVSYFFIYKNPEELLKKLPQTSRKKLMIVDEDSNKRPIAVMIDNNVGNNLHAGLQDSYINYEIIVEGGLTRIMALYKDKDVSLIGPVRSSRHYFLDYALESDAIYAHFGWSTFAEADIKSLGVNNINGLYDETPFWRDKSIAAPHNVFTSIKQLYTAADEKEYETTTDSWRLLDYDTTPINLDDPIDTKTVKNEETGKKEKVEIRNEELISARTVTIPYSNSQERSYTYDEANGYYLRYMNQKPHLDKTTNEQLHYKNIIIEQVSNSTLDSYGRQDLDTTGKGNGYYITNGYALPIFWTKNQRSGKTEYTYSDGKSVKVNDGNTFIQIQPITRKATFE